MLTKIFITVTVILSFAWKQNQKTNIADKADLVIANVTLIDGTGSESQQNANIYIKDGRIVEISQNSKTEADSIIDGTGKYLIPGLFDNHFHFPYERERALRQLIHFGATSIFNTGSSHTSYDMIRDLIRLEKADSLIAPNIYYTSYYVTIPGAHPAKNIDSETSAITGNITDTEDRNIYFITSEEDIPRFVEEAKQGGAYAMKIIIEDGPLPPFVERISQDWVNKLVNEAHNQNLKAFAHISDPIEIKMGLTAGIDGFVHSSVAGFDSELMDMMVGDSIPIVTTNMLLKSPLYPFNPEWKKTSHWEVYDDDQIATIEQFEPGYKKSIEPLLRQYVGATEFKLKEMQPMLSNFKVLNDSGLTLVVGTDAGANPYILPGYSVHEELQLLQLGGMEPLDIIRSATLNAAIMLDVDDDYGSLEAGKIADMILLDNNPLEDISNTLSINTVFKRGKVQPRIKND